jgi:hypothetical protein
MITQRDLVQRLARSNLAGWSVIERVQDLATADDRALQRRDRRTRLALMVHHDVPRGRGSARLDVDAYDGTAEDLVDQATSLALAAVGPAWSSTPPAAPAKVAIVDSDIVKRDLAAVAQGTLARLHRPADLTIAASIDVLRENVTVVASSGFHTSWVATTLRATALLSASTSDHSLLVTREARRSEDFRLDAALSDAAADLRHLSTATTPTPGPCALWLAPDALLHDTDPTTPYGLWTIFAHQADSTLERQGLTRYRWRSEIAPGASQLPEPLTITSNGALDFATRSTPVSDDAVAIRQFPLIDRGVAIGLGLSPREAALRRTDPNGGVRNLIVAPGTWSTTPSPATRTIELRRLHALSIDPYTGDAILDIALAFDHRPNHEPTPFTGGTIRLDLVTTLARAHRSSHLLRRGAYHGPSNILIDDAALLL